MCIPACILFFVYDLNAMITVSVILQTTKILKDGSSPVVIRFTRQRVRKYLRTGFSSRLSDWDLNKNLFKLSKSKSNMEYSQEIIEKNRKLLYLLQKAETYIIKSREAEPVVFDKLVIYMSSNGKSNYILKYFDSYIESLKKSGRLGSARNYENTKSSLEKFLHNRDITLETFDYSMIKKFQQWKESEGCSTNTVMFHFRQLKVIYNKAVNEGLVEKDYYPFDKIKIKQVHTVKRAITKDELINIKDLKLAEGSHLDIARDLFLMSYYLRGMSFKDLAHLQVKNIQGDRLFYNRAKTEVFYNMKLVEGAIRIIKKFNDLTKPEDYIFHIIDGCNKEELDKQYRLELFKLNNRLKSIGKMVGLSISLTTYVARHTWATVAKKSGVSIAVISEGMGHSSEEMTKIYLDSFENEVLDDANAVVTEL